MPNLPLGTHSILKHTSHSNRVRPTVSPTHPQPSCQRHLAMSSKPPLSREDPDPMSLDGMSRNLGGPGDSILQCACLPLKIWFIIPVGLTEIVRRLNKAVEDQRKQISLVGMLTSF